MDYALYQVDAFTNRLFGGNPACVIPLDHWLEDEILLKIAKENAVPETAFFVANKESFHLRWFTPDLEMDLCGHATLATAHILKTQLQCDREIIHFNTLSGRVQVSVKDDYYFLDFPSRMPVRKHLPQPLGDALSLMPKEVYKARDFVLLYEKEEDIKNIEIERSHFDELDLGTGGVILTAQGSKVDFVSRFFTPRATILEDPVTGSAHCSLIPFWANILNKERMTAAQISSRGGHLVCVNKEDRVLIGGKARTYFQGKFKII